jgi:putative FmdB family regulatory protein
MPLYEYYCHHCDGVFEQLRSIREASEPSPCPLCDRDSERIMPTSFSAFTFRDGYPRRIPDRGTYWHLGKEVKTPNTGGVPPNEHPELYKPDPAPTLSRGEREDKQELQQLEKKALRRLQDSGIQAPYGPDGKPRVNPFA